MKRLHVHVAVDDVPSSIRFYSALFATEPSVHKHDYAKWMLDDPRVNFAISSRGAGTGVEHLGMQVESAQELRQVQARLDRAGGSVLDEGHTTCCYAQSQTSWIRDPQGVAWEAFLTTGESVVYGDDPDLSARDDDSGCCTPETPQGSCCAPKADLPADAPCCGAAA